MVIKLTLRLKKYFDHSIELQENFANEKNFFSKLSNEELIYQLAFLEGSSYERMKRYR